MKEFTDAKVQYVATDFETDEKYTLSIGKLVQNADVEAITAIGAGLDSLIDGEITYAKVVESHFVSL